MKVGFIYFKIVFPDPHWGGSSWAETFLMRLISSTFLLHIAEEWHSGLYSCHLSARRRCQRAQWLLTQQGPNNTSAQTRRRCQDEQDFSRLTDPQWGKEKAGSTFRRAHQVFSAIITGAKTQLFSACAWARCENEALGQTVRTRVEGDKFNASHISWKHVCARGEGL